MDAKCLHHDDGSGCGIFTKNETGNCDGKDTGKGCYIDTVPDPIRYKIAESIPRNGIIIIAIKPDLNGEYNSRKEAMGAIRNKYDPRKTQKMVCIE